MLGAEGTGGGTVNIIDFDLAKAKWIATASSLTEPGSTVGTYTFTAHAWRTSSINQLVDSH
jgi:hypothetical protein